MNDEKCCSHFVVRREIDQMFDSPLNFLPKQPHFADEIQQFCGMAEDDWQSFGGVAGVSGGSQDQKLPEFQSSFTDGQNIFDSPSKNTLKVASSPVVLLGSPPVLTHSALGSLTTNFGGYKASPELPAETSKCADGQTQSEPSTPPFKKATCDGDVSATDHIIDVISSSDGDKPAVVRSPMGPAILVDPQGSNAPFGSESSTFLTSSDTVSYTSVCGLSEAKSDGVATENVLDAASLFSSSMSGLPKVLASTDGSTNVITLPNVGNAPVQYVLMPVTSDVDGVSSGQLVVGQLIQQAPLDAALSGPAGMFEPQTVPVALHDQNDPLVRQLMSPGNQGLVPSCPMNAPQVYSAVDGNIFSIPQGHMIVTGQDSVVQSGHHPAQFNEPMLPNISSPMNTGSVLMKIINPICRAVIAAKVHAGGRSRANPFVAGLRDLDRVEELFSCSYFWQDTCSACGHRQVNRSDGVCVTFMHEIPSGWVAEAPSRPEVMCSSCSKELTSCLRFLQLPGYLMYYFDDGLPDNWQKLVTLLFSGGKAEYRLKCIAMDKEQDNAIVVYFLKGMAWRRGRYNKVIGSRFGEDLGCSSVSLSSVDPELIRVLIWEYQPDLSYMTGRRLSDPVGDDSVEETLAKVASTRTIKQNPDLDKATKLVRSISVESKQVKPLVDSPAANTRKRKPPAKRKPNRQTKKAGSSKPAAKCESAASSSAGSSDQSSGEVGASVGFMSELAAIAGTGSNLPGGNPSGIKSMGGLGMDSPAHAFLSDMIKREVSEKVQETLKHIDTTPKEEHSALKFEPGRPKVSVPEAQVGVSVASTSTASGTSRDGEDPLTTYTLVIEKTDNMCEPNDGTSSGASGSPELDACSLPDRNRKRPKTSNTKPKTRAKASNKAVSSSAASNDTVELIANAVLEKILKVDTLKKYEEYIDSKMENCKKEMEQILSSQFQNLQSQAMPGTSSSAVASVGGAVPAPTQSQIVVPNMGTQSRHNMLPNPPRFDQVYTRKPLDELLDRIVGKKRPSHNRSNLPFTRDTASGFTFSNSRPGYSGFRAAANGSQLVPASSGFGSGSATSLSPAHSSSSVSPSPSSNIEFLRHNVLSSSDTMAGIQVTTSSAGHKIMGHHSLNTSSSSMPSPLHNSHPRPPIPSGNLQQPPIDVGHYGSHSLHVMAGNTFSGHIESGSLQVSSNGTHGNLITSSMRHAESSPSFSGSFSTASSNAVVLPAGKAFDEMHATGEFGASSSFLPSQRQDTAIRGNHATAGQDSDHFDAHPTSVAHHPDWIPETDHVDGSDYFDSVVWDDPFPL